MANDGTGAFFFTKAFDTEGTYTYTIIEKAGTDNTILYDDSVYTVTVTVQKHQTENRLEATTIIKKRNDVKSTISFENTTKPETTSCDVTIIWKHTWMELPKDGVYEVFEVNPPALYSAQKDVTGNSFVYAYSPSIVIPNYLSSGPVIPDGTDNNTTVNPENPIDQENQNPEAPDDTEKPEGTPSDSEDSKVQTPESEDKTADSNDKASASVEEQPQKDNGNIPQTGDNLDMSKWLMIAVLAAAALCMTLVMLAKSKNQE